MSILPKELENIIYGYLHQLKFVDVMDDLKNNIIYNNYFDITVLTKTQKIIKNVNNVMIEQYVKKKETHYYADLFESYNGLYCYQFTPFKLKTVLNTWHMRGYLHIHRKETTIKKQKCHSCNVFVYKKNFEKHCATKTHLKNIHNI